MQQLTEMDNNFLEAEKGRAPLHISPVIVYDQSHRREGKVRFKEILTVFERNLHKSPILRRKLAGGAMGLDTPYWVEDPDFDLEFHVRHLALPRPGDWRQFCILLSRVHARGLDLTRPLWEAYVIEGLSGVEGLPGNSFAIMLKIHHAAIDGVSGAEIVAAIHSLTDEIEPPPAEDDWQGERDPATWYVWSRAYLHNLKRPLKFFETVGSLVPAVIRANRTSNKRQGEQRKHRMARTRFNNRISASRVTEAQTMDLATIKDIRASLDIGVTINDIMVSIVGGGMRKYLDSKGELPADSLSCGAPISTRREHDGQSTGNQVSLMVIGLATDIADPIERLRAVHDDAESAKAYAGTLGSSMMMDLSEMLIPQFMGWGFSAATLAATHTAMPMPFHTLVSNVPGPQFPLYLAGARIHLTMGMGPLVDMMGLFHAVISGAGKITINFVSTREMLPDPLFYRSCLTQAYEELLAATSGKKPTKKRAKRTAKAAAKEGSTAAKPKKRSSRAQSKKRNTRAQPQKRKAKKQKAAGR